MSFTNIDDPSAYFHTQLYTGTGSSHSVTNDANAGDFKPDWVWLKERSSTGGNKIYDSTRGVQEAIQTQSSGAETTTAQGLTAFNTDGFTVGSDGGHNQSSATYVAWQWKANGGSTTSQTGANIDSVTQANTTAGFSIVTYTGNTGTGQSVKHGLGTTPHWILIKRRDGTGDWFVYHKDVGNTKYLKLNSAGTETTSSEFGNYGPDATSFFVSGNTCVNTATYVAYAFAEKQGYSAFGSYIGSGARSSAPFIYTGFKPRFLISKNVTGSGSWSIWDTKRNPINGDTDYVIANGSDAESNSGFGLNDPFYFYSNGFGVMNADGWSNAVNQTYIYMAFAENPFVTSTGIPTTAR
tara:strand:+ start:2329 stop:3384 length:1056 start_codon:yes stop_codon:yes gene_type:complete